MVRDTRHEPIPPSSLTSHRESTARPRLTTCAFCGTQPPPQSPRRARSRQQPPPRRPSRRRSATTPTPRRRLAHHTTPPPRNEGTCTVNTPASLADRPACGPHDSLNVPAGSATSASPPLHGGLPQAFTLRILTVHVHPRTTPPPPKNEKRACRRNDDRQQALFHTRRKTRAAT